MQRIKVISLKGLTDFSIGSALVLALPLVADVALFDAEFAQEKNSGDQSDLCKKE
jgi:hypothetical protein